MIYFFIFILGLFIGSFLGVLIDRLPKNEGILLGRSHCDNCKKELSPVDLIPVLSFLFLKGKCRYCHIPLSTFYPAIEIITGIIFTFTYYFVWLLHPVYDINFFATLIYYLVISSGLLVISLTDLRSGIIPNKILIFISLFSLVLQLIFARPDLPNHLISAGISFVLFVGLTMLTKGRGMGFGDTKFAFVLGLILGFPQFVLALYVAFLTGATISIILILWGKKRLKGSTIAFGPFMAIGVFTALYFGNIIIPKLLPFLVQ